MEVVFNTHDSRDVLAYPYVFPRDVLYVAETAFLFNSLMPWTKADLLYNWVAARAKGASRLS